MYIGEVTRATGASRKDIRLYEKMGLIEKPERNGNYRVYEEHHSRVINMIKRAQAVGFKLAELVVLTDEKSESNRFPVDLALKLINEKREELASRIPQIQKTDAELVTLSEEVVPGYKILRTSPKWLLVAYAKMDELKTKLTGRRASLIVSQVEIFNGCKQEYNIDKSVSQLNYRTRTPSHALQKTV